MVLKFLFFLVRFQIDLCEGLGFVTTIAHLDSWFLVLCQIYGFMFSIGVFNSSYSSLQVISLMSISSVALLLPSLLLVHLACLPPCKVFAINMRQQIEHGLCMLCFHHRTRSLNCMKIHELDECFLHNLGKLPTT